MVYPTGEDTVTDKRSTFGSIRKLPSGRYQARYTAPDGKMRKAPVTYDTRLDAGTWLTTIRADIIRGTWAPPAAESDAYTFGAYAESWLEQRDLKPRTRD